MSEEQQVEQPVIQGPGQLLQAARKAMNLSAEQVAQRLNLREYMINDLESDNYDTTISLTFTKGYLKSYAKLVKVSEQQVLEAFEQINRASKEPAKLQSFSRRVARQASDDRLMMVTYVILAILIALSVMWWLQQSGEDELTERTYPNTQTEKNLQKDSGANQVEPANNTNEAVQSAVNDDALVESSALEQDSPDSSDDSITDTVVDDNIVDNVSESADLASESVEQQSNDAVVDQIAEDVTPAQDLADPVELVFEFSEDCWINIIDATGEAIAYGIKVSGRVMPVTGIPPFQVTVAVPESVKVSYAGEQFDMSQFPAGRTARFTLPLQE